MGKIHITTVTPVYSGNDFLPDLVDKLEQVREEWISSKSPLELSEAIFVNDASTDGSLCFLQNIQEVKSWVRVVNLSRNFGQHQATIAGILHSSGDWVVTLDEDLQHDPLLIEKMLEYAVKLEIDIVYANPEQSVHENPLRDWTSRTFKRLVSYVTGNRHVKEFSSFRLIRGTIARASGSVCSHDTYFDVALCWFTDRVSPLLLPLKDIRFIEKGKSGYTMRKLFSHARRMIVTSETKLIRLGGLIGFLAMFVALSIGSKILFDKIVAPESIPVQGWTSLILVFLFFNGLIAALLGLVLEYLSIVLLHTQGKPTFFVVDRMSDKILLDYYKTNTQSDDHFSKTALPK